MEKSCRICGNSFNTIKNGGSRQFCFDCVPTTTDLGQRTNFKRQAMKKEGVKRLGNQCLKCGESKYYLLDFHHLDGSDKDATPSRLIADSKIEDFFSEIEKCVLLCSNCHRELHWLESQGQEVNVFQKVKIETVSPRIYIEPSFFCSKCETPISKESKTGLCGICYDFERRIVKDRPSGETLIKEIQNSSILAVGRKYGVSDNTIRKWLKAYGLPTLIKEIKEMNMGE